jgi:CHAT domain-containing protein/Tfp pilus assembly protein PilF
MEASLKSTERSLELATEIGYQPGIALAQRDIASYYWRAGDLDKSLEISRTALHLAEQLGDKVLIYQLYGNQALVYWNQGDLNKALELFGTSSKMAEEVGNLQGVAINALNIGSIQMNLGNYKESRESFQSSMEQAERIPDKGLLAVCLDELGILERLVGNYDEALSYVERSIRLTREIGEKRPLAYALKNQGLLYARMGNYITALKSLDNARLLYEEMQEKRAIANTYNEIGYIQEGIGKNEEAMQAYTKAFAVAESIGTKSDLEDCYNNMGSIYLKRGEMEKAEVNFDKAIQLSEETGHTNSLSTGLYKKGLLLAKTNRPELAVGSLENSIAVIERVRSDVDVEERAGYLADNLEVYEALVLQLASMQNLPEAFDYVQKAKARSFLEMLAEARIDPEKHLSDVDKLQKKKLITELTSIQEQTQEEADKEAPDKLKLKELTKKRAALEIEYSDLIQQIRSRNPIYADIQFHRSLKLQEAQAMLDDQSALLEYFVGKSGSLIFVITRNDAKMLPLAPEKKLADQVREIRETLQKPEPIWETSEKSYTRYVTSSRALYSELIEPATALLKDKQRVLIASDGVLNYLPFETLLTDKTSATNINFAKLPYLERNFAIHYIPSVSVLAAVEAGQKDAKTPSHEFLAIADPVISSQTASLRVARNTKLAALPNARTEVQQISRLYPTNSVSVLMGKDASESHLKQIPLDQYRRIHFACHGLIDEERPQFSALVLGTESGKSEDGYLTMREIFDLKLNSDLVVLSACNTGLGKQVRGEGVTSLTRAFLLAGTPRVVVSLWSVYDRSSADLMTAFYQNLEEKKMSQVAALQAARLKLIASGKYSHPYYWAPFILIGAQ